jgi:hypothetical protein
MGRQLDIDIDGKDDLGPELSKSKGDHIVWSSDDADFTVIFNHAEGSPFAEERFYVRASGPGADSGPPVKGMPGTSYHYIVQDGIRLPGEKTPPTGSPKVRIKV